MPKCVGNVVDIKTNLPEGYEQSASFTLTLMNVESFDGFDNSNGGCGYMDEHGRSVPFPSTKPTPERVQLECCIKAASKLYWDFFEEYKEKYGEEFNG